MMLAPLDGLDVLVVEDDYFIAMELCRLLRTLGAGIVGPAARLPLDPVIAAKPVDVALLDVQLGADNSLLLVDDMARRGVPVALITGYAPHVLPMRYRALRRLDKPINREELVAAVLILAGRTEGVAA